MYLGYGRESAGRVGSVLGFNAYPVRNHLRIPSIATGSVKKVDGKWGIAITKSHYQDHRGKNLTEHGNENWSLEAVEALGPRGIIRYATLEDFKANPNFAHEGEGHETPSSTPRCSPTGRTTATSGACRST